LLFVLFLFDADTSPMTAKDLRDMLPCFHAHCVSSLFFFAPDLRRQLSKVERDVWGCAPYQTLVLAAPADSPGRVARADVSVTGGEKEEEGGREVESVRQDGLSGGDDGGGKGGGGWVLPVDSVPPSIRAAIWPLAPLYPQCQQTHGVPPGTC
jgi:hypothetical protein